MNAIAGNERIVVSFRDFVAKRGHILEASAEEPWADPTGVVHHIAALPIAVAGIAGFEVIGVETQHAAGIRAAEVQIRVGEQECGHVLSRDVASILGCANRGSRVRGNRGKQQVHEFVDVDQNERAARLIRIARKVVQSALVAAKPGKSYDGIGRLRCL